MEGAVEPGYERMVLGAGELLAGISILKDWLACRSDERQAKRDKDIKAFRRKRMDKWFTVDRIDEDTYIIS